MNPVLQRLVDIVGAIKATREAHKSLTIGQLMNRIAIDPGMFADLDSAEKLAWSSAKSKGFL